LRFKVKATLVEMANQFLPRKTVYHWLFLAENMLQRKTTPKIDISKWIGDATFRKEYAAFSDKPSDAD